MDALKRDSPVARTHSSPPAARRHTSEHGPQPGLRSLTPGASSERSRPSHRPGWRRELARRHTRTPSAAARTQSHRIQGAPRHTAALALQPGKEDPGATEAQVLQRELFRVPPLPPGPAHSVDLHPALGQRMNGCTPSFRWVGERRVKFLWLPPPIQENYIYCHLRQSGGS